LQWYKDEARLLIETSRNCYVLQQEAERLRIKAEAEEASRLKQQEQEERLRSRPNEQKLVD